MSFITIIARDEARQGARSQGWPVEWYCRVVSICLSFIMAVPIFYQFPLHAQDGLISLEQVQKRLQEDPEDRDALLALAMHQTIDKQYQKAVETYFRLLKIDPKNFHAFHNLGILYRKVGQYNDSLHCYQEALKINPNASTVYYNMGLAYEAMGRMQEARETYGRALSLNPDLTQALQRLRDLSEDAGKATPLPEPPPNILVVDTPEGPAKPLVISHGSGEAGGGKKAEADSTKIGKSADKADDKSVSGKSAEKQPDSKSTPAKPAAKIEDTHRKPAEMVRTMRTGPGVAFYHKSMDALEKEDLKSAIEQYVLCILKDRDFLSEPDNGLIQKGLQFLKERPNAVSDSFFYRGFLISLTGSLEAAQPDLKLYLEKNPKGAFITEAQEIIDRYEAHLKAMADAKAASEAAIIANRSISGGASETATFTPRPDDITLKKMNPDEILDEARLLSREGRLRDAIAVLRAGLEKEPDNPPLLMGMANAYVDLMLSKGDAEAGKMATSLFEKVVALTPPDSKESKTAQSMIQELGGKTPER
ncbi:MAG: tetratricopeptide repeat protein [Candidatus Riflebacteria bacterium]|nr:tetratricopeptide repeat protein [Candidatus Riflebacteria bacterium]